MMELVLVCAILMAVAAIGVPYIIGMLSGSKIDEAKDAVQAAFTQGRTQAIRDGRAYRLEIKNNSGQYRLVVADDTTVPNDQQMQTAISEVKRLPEEVYFCCTGGGDGSGAGGWMPVVVFQADGTGSDDAMVRFRMNNSVPVVVQFRGSTGRVENCDWEGEGQMPVSAGSSVQ